MSEHCTIANLTSSTRMDMVQRQDESKQLEVKDPGVGRETNYQIVNFLEHYIIFSGKHYQANGLFSKWSMKAEIKREDDSSQPAPYQDALL